MFYISVVSHPIKVLFISFCKCQLESIVKNRGVVLLVKREVDFQGEMSSFLFYFDFQVSSFFNLKKLLLMFNFEVPRKTEQ